MTRTSIAAWLLLGTGLACAPAAAQDREAVFQAYLEFASLVDGASLTPNWLPDGSGFWYTDGSPQNRQVWRVDPAAKAKTPFFDVARLRAALGDFLGYEPPRAGVPFETFAVAPDGSTITFALDGAALLLDLRSYAVSRAPPPDPAAAALQARMTPQTFPRRIYFGMTTDVAETLSPDGKWFARLEDDDIVLRSTADGRELRLTDDGTADNAWDIESLRLKLGAGLTVDYVPFSSWSPDSLKLWATKIDRSQIPVKFEVRYLKTVDEVVERPFTIAGGQLSRVQPYVVDILSGETLPVDVGDPGNAYINLLGWMPDSSEVLFARFSRDFKTVEILAANSDTGSVRNVMTETTDTFVKIQHDVIVYGDTGFTEVGDGRRFLWESTRDGWNHLYLYQYDGRLVRQLTSGRFPVLDVKHVDADGGWVYFTAHGDTSRVYDTHLYRVNLGGGRVQQLTEAPGQHAVRFSPSYRYFIDTHSRPDTPPRIDLRAADGTFLMTLRNADISGLRALGWTPSEEFVVKSADGETDLWGVMHKPFDFDAGKKYPVVEFLYAGPQIVTADRSFAVRADKTSNLPRALAQLGYIVVTLDARGTPERSKAFQDVVYRSWGRHEIPDHAAAIRQLGERHAFMDLARVGIWGHSWGGHFAFRALAQAPDTYHAAISSAPGYDPYAGMLYEPYLDLPDRAKDAYEYASPFRLAPQIKGKLMIVGGTADYATFSEFMKMSRALIDAGVHHEQVVLPEEGHGYVGKANDYFIAALVGFFDRHLR